MRKAKRWDDIQEKPTPESDIIGNSSSIPHSSMKMHADPVPFFLPINMALRSNTLPYMVRIFSYTAMYRFFSYTTCEMAALVLTSICVHWETKRDLGSCFLGSLVRLLIHVLVSRRRSLLASSELAGELGVGVDPRGKQPPGADGERSQCGERDSRVG
jgi:hypothetical protein